VPGPASTPGQDVTCSVMTSLALMASLAFMATGYKFK